jgi:hypothetical protein
MWWLKVVMLEIRVSGFASDALIADFDPYIYL